MTVVTNYVPIHPSGTVKRFCSETKKYQQVPIPGPIIQYNCHMGGVDTFDQMFNLYKIRIRSKKWWWPLFVYFLNASMINAWRLYTGLKGNMPLLSFIRDVVSQLVRCYGSKPRVGRLSLIGMANDAARFDGKDHWPIESNVIGGVCPVCRGRTKIRCEKCDVALHTKCFKSYHVNYPRN